MQRPEQFTECDVLVIGGGGAGLTAAIEARQRGASVIVVTKSKAGHSGNTIVSGAQFAAVVPYEGSEDSPAQHFRDTLVGGRDVNDESLLRTLTEEGGPRVLKLEEWGVPLLRLDGELIRRFPPGHSHPRGIPTYNADFQVATAGLSITLPLRATGERMGARFLDETPVVRLVLADGEICGAVAIDLATDRLLLIGARSVVVATGGAGHIYANTNNTRDISGDSYGLLLQAGARLRDMEFVQFYPCQVSSPFKFSITSPLFVDGAVLRNRHGERFMSLYDPVNGDKATRDVMAQAIFFEVQKGNGMDGDVYADLTAVPEETLQTKYFTLARDLRKRGLDPARDWLKTRPTTHFFMGGVEVDAPCHTAIPGLFVAGEAVGGVHGANRLSGNALTETVVFGPIAGVVAAEYALKRTSMPEPTAESVTLETGGGESLDAVRTELRKAMWEGASIVRSETSLRSTLSTVRECASAVPRCPAASATEAARREETRLICLTAEAVVISALAREESRGAHLREDFPATEDRWLGSHMVRLAGEGLQVEFVPKESSRHGFENRG